MLADEALYAKFVRQVEAIPFGRPQWDAAFRGQVGRKLPEPVAVELDRTPSVEWAVQYFCLVRQSRSGGGKGWATLTRRRTRRNSNEQASAWWSAVTGLDGVHERLEGVVVERLDYQAFVRKYDDPGVFFYMDPPYHPDTVTTGVYDHGMTAAQHEDMLEFLQGVKARVMLSGYQCPPYRAGLKHWRRREFAVTDHYSSDKVKAARVECLWMNYGEGGDRLRAVGG